MFILIIIIIIIVNFSTTKISERSTKNKQGTYQVPHIAHKKDINIRHTEHKKNRHASHIAYREHIDIHHTESTKNLQMNAQRNIVILHIERTKNM